MLPVFFRPCSQPRTLVPLDPEVAPLSEDFTTPEEYEALALYFRRRAWQLAGRPGPRRPGHRPHLPGCRYRNLAELLG